MINDEVLIKFERERGYKHTWPEQVIAMKSRLVDVKLGFPGIRNDHLSLIRFDQVQRGDIFIYDQYLETPGCCGDEAPMMLRSLGNDQYLIEGIGCGVDSIRDPDRTKYRWKDIITVTSIPGSSAVLRVDIKPTFNGGPGYYYFYKSYRDFRL